MTNIWVTDDGSWGDGATAVVDTIWVADDGSWGGGIVEIFDISQWTESEVEQVEEASDGERLDIARRIAQGKKG